MKLLIVDDSRLIRYQIQDLIQLHYPESDIRLAENGEEALTLIKQFRPQVVLLDIIMPKFSGIEVLQLISPQLEAGDLKAIMFTSVDDKITMKECFELGASDFINKPVDEIETIARLGNAFKLMALQDAYNQLKEQLSIKERELARLTQAMERSV